MLKYTIILIVVCAFTPCRAQVINEPVIKDSIEVKSTPVKCQYFTGTCWNFATTSFIESEVLRMHGKQYDLSEKYIVNLNYIDKVSKFIRLHGHMNLQQGSQAHDAMLIMSKSGIVPESIYPMATDIDHTKIHIELLNALSGMLKGIIGDGYNPITDKYPTATRNVLSAYLGELPGEFLYEGKRYTPESFYAEHIKLNVNDYIEITSVQHEPYYQRISLDLPDNWRHSLYLNLPLDQFVDVINNSIKMGYSLVWDGDVTEGGYDVNKTIYDTDYTNDRLNQDPLRDISVRRQKDFDSWETTDDHLMHLIGIATNSQGAIYYKLKDSAGENHPYVYISLPYLMLRTVTVMVHKDVLPKNIAKKLAAVAGNN